MAEVEEVWSQLAAEVEEELVVERPQVAAAVVEFLLNFR